MNKPPLEPAAPDSPRLADSAEARSGEARGRGARGAEARGRGARSRRAALGLIGTFGLLGALSACGGSGTPVAALDGTWTGRTGPQGISLSMTLAQHGSVVSGNGTYGAAAGLNGNMSVTGTTTSTATGTQVELSFALDDNTTATWSGALTYLKLNGTWTHAGTSTALEFDLQ